MPEVRHQYLHVITLEFFLYTSWKHTWNSCKKLNYLRHCKFSACRWCNFSSLWILREIATITILISRKDVLKRFQTAAGMIFTRTPEKSTKIPSYSHIFYNNCVNYIWALNLQKCILKVRKNQ